MKPLPSATAVAVIAVVFAGCGSAGNPTAAVAGSSSPAATSPVASQSPTRSPSAASPSAGAGASPSSAAVPHDDAALEALLPDEVNDVPLTKLSVGPISTAGNTGADPIRSLAREIGDGSGNFSLAFANDPRTPTFNVFALRVHGAKADELAERYTELTVADAAGSTSRTTKLGGKDVIEVTAPNNPLGDVWFYASGDTVFGVQAGSPEQASSLLEQLP